MQSTFDRPGTLRLPPAERGWSNTLWSIVGILMFAAMLAAAGVYTAPALITDWQIRGAARPVPNAGVSDGKCTSKLVFHICDATLTLPRSTTRHVNYVFTGVHVGDYRIAVMADPAHPELATTDMALDRLWNRTVTLLAIAIVLLALTVLPILAMIRNRRAAGALT